MNMRAIACSLVITITYQYYYFYHLLRVAQELVEPHTEVQRNKENEGLGWVELADNIYFKFLTTPGP